MKKIENWGKDRDTRKSVCGLPKRTLPVKPRKSSLTRNLKKRDKGVQGNRHTKQKSVLKGSVLKISVWEGGGAGGGVKTSRKVENSYQKSKKRAAVTGWPVRGWGEGWGRRLKQLRKKKKKKGRGGPKRGTRKSLTN